MFGACVVIGGLVLTLSGDGIGPTWPFFGASLAFAGSMWILAELFGVPDEILNWRRGAAGEEETARALATLPPAFVVLHDRKIPRSPANIDHIVIGPTGVFVVETKRYSGRLTVRGSDVFVAGRRRTKIVEQARWEAEVVAKVLADADEPREVTPLLCIHRAELPWRTARVGGVAIVSGSGLTATLTKAPEALSADEVARLGVLLDSALAKATRSRI